MNLKAFERMQQEMAEEMQRQLVPKLQARASKLFEKCGGDAQGNGCDQDKLAREVALRLCLIEELLAMMGLLNE